MIAFRQAPPGVPFAWEARSQPAARWHSPGEGPATYLSTTPDAAWAEFLRHEGITDPADLEGVERFLWAVEVPDDVVVADVRLPARVAIGDAATYVACREEAHRLRGRGARAIRAPSAAVVPGRSGFRTDGVLVSGPRRREHTIVLFGRWPELIGWIAAGPGRPDPSLLPRVRPLAA